MIVMPEPRYVTSSSARQRRGRLATLLLALFVLVLACPKTESPPAMRKAPPSVAESKPALWSDPRFPVYEDDPIFGPRQAPVTLVVYMDFTSKECAELATTITALRGKYGDRLRVVFKDRPLVFRKTSLLAAIAGHAVFATQGSEAFARYHDALFANQGKLDRAFVLAVAEDNGADAQTVEAHRERATKKLDRSREEAWSLGLEDVPAMTLDGEVILGPSPFEHLVERIDLHLFFSDGLIKMKFAPEKVFGKVITQFTQYQGKPSHYPGLHDVRYMPVGSSCVRGRADALVTVVFFGDVLVRPLRRITIALREIENDFGDDVRFVYKHRADQHFTAVFPSGPISNRDLMILLEEARAQKGCEGFWALHDELLADAIETTTLGKTFVSLGLDPARMQAALDARSHQGTIDADESDAEVADTWVAVNGRPIIGVPSALSIRRAVEGELGKARALVEGGTPRATLYDTLIAFMKPKHLVLDVPKTSPVRGPAKAKVVVQMFVDLPSARSSVTDEQGALPRELALSYPKDVRLVVRFTLTTTGARSRIAAFALEVRKQRGDDVFFKVFEELSAGEYLEDADLELIAKKHAVDWKKALAAMQNGTWNDALSHDAAALEEMTGRTPPLIFVDGDEIPRTRMGVSRRLRRVLDAKTRH